MLNATKTLRILAALSLAVPALLFGLYAWSAYESNFNRARSNVSRTADVVREHGIKVFETHRLAAQQVETILYDRTDDNVRQNQAELQRRLNALASKLPQIEDIWVLDKDGYALITAYTPVAERSINLSDRQYFTAHRDGLADADGAYVSEILRGRARPGIFFQASYARRLNGQFAGVIAISLQPQYFHDFYRTVGANNVSAIGLVRADGAVLSHYPATVQDLPRMPIAKNFAEEAQKNPESGTYEGLSVVSNTVRLVSYTRLPGYPVYVAVGTDRPAVIAAWQTEMLTQFGLGLPVTLAVFALCMLALRLTKEQTAAMAQLRQAIEERDVSEERMRQLQKMEAVGQLTGGIAHDFNNLLTIVLGSLDLMRRRLEKGENDVMRFVDSAMEGAKRAAALTARLLAFSRKQMLDPKPVDVNRLLSGMSELLRRTIGEQIKVETVLGGGLWLTKIDANQLENAILNLAVNARDAMPEGGCLTLETANGYLDDAYAAQHGDVTSGQYVVICVTDTGSGMPPDVVARAFEPFFTTKAPGQGTGLGLSQVYGFVKQSGGHIRIYSEQGHGTTIKIYMPRFVGEGGVATPVIPFQPIERLPDAETVLVVEDEEHVRRFSAQALRELGYDVVEANGGAAALEILRDRRDIRLLFTDIIMPGMNGSKLAIEAKRIAPDLRILYTTGYSRNAIVHNGVLDTGTSLLSKPFTVQELAAKVRQVLDQT